MQVLDMFYGSKSTNKLPMSLPPPVEAQKWLSIVKVDVMYVHKYDIVHVPILHDVSRWMQTLHVHLQCIQILFAVGEPWEPDHGTGGWGSDSSAGSVVSGELDSFIT